MMPNATSTVTTQSGRARRGSSGVRRAETVS